jgi:hypothetical protein
MYDFDDDLMSCDALYARADIGIVTTPDHVPRPLSAVPRDSSSKNIWESEEAFLNHHRHAVQHRHVVSRFNAPPLVPEATSLMTGTPGNPALGIPGVRALKKPTPTRTKQTHTRKVPVPTPNKSCRAEQQVDALNVLLFATSDDESPRNETQETETKTETSALERRVAELNDRAVVEASGTNVDAPAIALRSLNEAHVINNRVRALIDAATSVDSVDLLENNTHLAAIVARSKRRRAAVDAALHSNTACILLDPRLLDPKHLNEFTDTPRTALRHAKLACDADAVTGTDRAKASFSINLAARAFEAFGNGNEAALHRARAAAVRECGKRKWVEEETTHV